MKTLRRYLMRELVRSTGFILFALLALFAFFDLLAQIDDLRPGAYTLPAALAYVALSLPSRTYELMPIAALIGAIFALSQLATNSEFTIMRVSGMSTRALVRRRVGSGSTIWVARHQCWMLVTMFLPTPRITVASSCSKTRSLVHQAL